MRQRLTSADLSIEELLSGNFAFTIPAYQRDYTWTREEAIQLVDDLAAVIEDVERDGAQTPYFLGTMLFVETRSKADPANQPAVARMVEVVDGQQRLVTLTILFAVLRDMADGDDIDPMAAMLARRDGQSQSFHLSLRGTDEEFFRTAIQNTGATRRSRSADAIGESAARRNIEDVRRGIRSKLQREFSVSARRELAQFVRNDARVLVVSSDDFDYAYQIFLTINDRGKQLSVEDIFRGEILGPLDREQRRRYEAIIDEMEKYREEAEPQRTKGKTFFSHLATIDGWPRRGIIESLKRAVEQRGGPRRYVTEIFSPRAESYLQIKSAPGAAPLPANVQHWLTALHWLELHGDDDWIPAAMLGIARHAAEPERLDHFLRCLDRFAHGLMALGCGREGRRKHYAPVIKVLAESPNQPPPEKLFAMTAANQKTILRHIATRMYMVDPPTTKLILIRADQMISGRPIDSYRAAVERDRTDPERYTVEHVCPKGGEIADGAWTRLFARRNVRHRAAQCIGNLVLVTEIQNKRSGQKDFPDKQKLFFGTTPASPFFLTEMLRDEVDWDATAITRRYNLIMSAVKEMWALQGAVPACPALGNVPAPPRQPGELSGIA